jgi:hypothetical protein
MPLLINDYLPQILIPVTRYFPSGALRIAGDSPSGLVLVGMAPASRTVDIFDRETKVLVATTVSAGDGTYEFTNLSSRTEGYDVIIRGVILDGERDVIIPGVHPI